MARALRGEVPGSPRPARTALPGRARGPAARGEGEDRGGLLAAGAPGELW